MLFDDQCIVAQLRQLISRKGLGSGATGRSQALGNSARIRLVTTTISASMERSAPLAIPLNLSPSRANSRVAVSSIGRRLASGRPRRWEVKSFGVEVSPIQRSSQPPPFVGVGIASGQVVLVLSRHVEADFRQGGDHVGAAPQRAVLDALDQVVADRPLRVGVVFESGPQLRRLDVGPMARLLRPGPRRVVGTAPAVLVFEGVGQRSEGPLTGLHDLRFLPLYWALPDRAEKAENRT